MSRRFLRAFCVSLLFVLPLLSGTGCRSLSFNKKKSFADWYFGPTGFQESLTETRRQRRCEGTWASGAAIQEGRKPYYGHFRIFEVIWQPAGGTQYPERLICPRTQIKTRTRRVQMRHTDKRGQDVPVGDPYFVEEKYHVGRFTSVPRNSAAEHLGFDINDAGIIDCLIPYRLLNADMRTDERLGGLMILPFTALMNLGMGTARVCIYGAHDVVKTCMIPFALVRFDR